MYSAPLKCNHVDFLANIKNVLPLPGKLYIKYVHSALSKPKQISFHFHFQLNRTFATLVLPAQINFLKIILLLIAPSVH